MYKIQDIDLKPVVGNENIRDMYYRSNKESVFFPMEKYIEYEEGAFLETFTYFGSVSAEKWKKYTYANRFYLILELEGEFDVTLFGHYQENKVIKKEWLGKFRYEISNRELIVIPYPIVFQSQVIAFSIYAISKIKIFNAYYAVDLEKVSFNSPYISLVTTTYKKEDFVKGNIDLLNKELFSDSEYKNKFVWHIVDNGKTLTSGCFDNITLVHNKNVGGAGGFARGMIDSLRQNIKPTHILLMDDDVKVCPESFKRLYNLLNILKDDYKDYFVSGAMLNLDAPNIQHENTGRLVDDGYCVPLHSGRDLNLWDQVLLNEEIDESISNRYAAWWFCCIPTSVASLENLPMPLFVRGDDMEYSIRNHAKFITLNGISVWHQGFVGKFNAPMDFYQSKRNELIVFTMRSELDQVDSFKAIEELFWHQMYKFDYTGAEFLIETVEDYLKGPEWFSTHDLFDELQKRREIDNKPRKIPDELRSKVDFENIYRHKKIGRLKKLIYDYTYNGQARIPNFLLPHKTGYISYDFGYYPSNQMLTNVNYAISPINDSYVEYKKDRKRFQELKNRWNMIKKDYLNTRKTLVEKYREYESRITNVDFWDKYLSDNDG